MSKPNIIWHKDKDDSLQQPEIQVKTYRSHDICHIRTNCAYLSVDGDGPVEDAVHAQDGRLWGVDDRGAHQRAENTAVTDGERAAVHVLDGQVTRTRLKQKNMSGLSDLSRNNSPADSGLNNQTTLTLMRAGFIFTTISNIIILSLTLDLYRIVT